MSLHFSNMSLPVINGATRNIIVVFVMAAVQSLENTPIASLSGRLLITTFTAAATAYIYDVAIGLSAELSGLNSKADHLDQIMAANAPSQSVEQARSSVNKAHRITVAASILAAWGGYKVMHGIFVSNFKDVNPDISYSAPVRNDKNIEKLYFYPQPTFMA